MVNKKFLWGIVVMALVIAMTVVGCEGEDGGKDKDPAVKEPDPTPLTGTVSVTSNVTADYSGVETKKLTANVTGSNASSFNYQWTRDGTNIGTSSTYNVVEADYGKTLTVTVTGYGNYSGTLSGNTAVGNPTILNLTLKRHATTWGKETGITIERINGNYWGTVRSSSSGTDGTLNTTGATITLTSWTETKFKMRTTYTMIESKFYFRKDNTSGSNEFDLTNGTKTYVLQTTDGGFGVLSSCIAIEQL